MNRRQATGVGWQATLPAPEGEVEASRHMGRRCLPTNGLPFKRVIGNGAHPDVESGFIGDMLGMEVGGARAQSPYGISWFRDALGGGRLASTVVDVLVGLGGGGQAVVETQAARRQAFLGRMPDDACRHHLGAYGSGRLMPAGGGGARHGALRPAHGIGVLGFDLFAGGTPLRSYSPYDVENGAFYGGGAATGRLGGLPSLTFLELRKPKGGVAGAVAHWMGFLKGHPLPGDAPAHIHKALGLAGEQRLTKEEAEMIGAIEMGIEDRKAQMECALSQGLEQGRAEGEASGKASVARAALLRGSDIGFVADITGLDAAAVEGIKAELPD
jgi:hypothetical protein